jgi:phosphohistidine phosphatase
MLLLLIRHAAAEERDPAQWPDDSRRPLTEKGRKVQSKVARFLRKNDLAPTLLLTSPWVRAVQTAEITTQGAGLTEPAVHCDALADDPDLNRLAECVGRQAPEAIVGMVGHSPWIEELAATLLGGSSDSLTVDFPKSGVMGLEVGDELRAGRAELRFFVRPKTI